MKKTLQATAFIAFIALCWLSAVAFGADYFKGSPAALFKGSTVQTGVGGVTTLTISSNTNRVLASGNHTDRLPVATTIGAIGRHFDFANRGSGTYTIQYQDGTTLTTVLPGRQKRVALTDASTSNGVWDVGFGEALSKTGDTMTGPLGLDYSNVTTDRAAYVDGSRLLRTSTSVSSQELEYLDGVTANIQAQLNAVTASIGGGPFLPLAGGTLSGALLLDTAPLTVLNATPTFRRNGVVDTEVRLEGVSTQAKLVTFRNNTVDRWKIGMLSNGNFGLLDYDSAGSFLGTLISIPSGSGVISITRALTVSDTALSTFGGSLKANQDILIGQTGAGTGGKVRIFCDSGLECWRIGPAGSTGAVDLDFRSQLAGAVAMSISTSGVTTTRRGFADGSLAVQTPAAATSYTVGTNIYSFVISPSTNLSVSSVTMPVSPQDGQILRVACSGLNGITTLTHVANAGQTLDNPLTSCTRGAGGEWVYHSSSSTWKKLTSIEPTVSELYLQGATTYGSTATKIRRYINLVRNTGNSWTLTQSATNGDFATLTKDGVYEMGICDNFSSAANAGVSINASSTTNGIQTLANTELACGNVSAGVDIGTCCTRSMYLPSGTVIRPHTDGTANGSNLWMQSFTIRRISN